MLAVHLERGRVSVRAAPLPRRPRGCARIELLLGGICNTDLELQRGYYGFRGTPGHEFVGRVLEADARELVGQRVVGEINLACRRCAWCRRGLARHCPTRRVLGILGAPGAFREVLTLPEANLHVVPRALSDAQACFAEPLAAACELLDQVAFERGERVAVLGDGKLGLLVAQVLLAHGQRVRVFGRHREKLAIAERAGAEVVHRARRLPRKAFRVVIEATGSAAGLAQAVGMCAPRGTLVLKSTVHGAVALETAPVIVDELTLLGSRCGRFEPALELLQRGAVDVDALIAETLPLAQAPRAFARAAQSGVLKVLLVGGRAA